jgi:excisionase family DNA binding protein
VEQSLTLSVPEAAALLGLSANHAWRLVSNGVIPSMRLGRRVLVPRAALVALVENAAAGRPLATAAR